MDPMFEDLLKTMKMGKGGGMGGMNLNKMMLNQMLGLELDTLKRLRLNLNSMIKKIETVQTTGKTEKAGDMFSDDMNPFTILGVKVGATQEEVNAAYKKRAWECHPDHGGTQEEMTKVNVAYEAMKKFFNWS